MLRAGLGIAPIASWNDDLEELSDGVSLEECLRQAVKAGLAGMEAGRRISMNMQQDPKENPPLDIAIKGRAKIKRVLDAAGYEVVS